MGRSLNVTSTYISTFVPHSRTSIVLARYVGPEACQTERTPDLGAIYHLEQESADHISFLHISQPEITAADDPRLVEAERHYMEQFEAKTLLSIPMQVAGRTIAYARLWESRQKREFTPEEISQCQAIAQQGAMAIENARLFEQTQNALQETEVLYRVTHALVQTDDEQEMFALVLTEFLQQLNLRQGGVLYVDEAANASLQTYIVDGQVATADFDASLAGTACYEQLTETSEPLIIQDVRYDSLLEPVRRFTAPFDLKSLLLVPILVRGEVIGLLAGDAAEINHDFSERDLSLARAMANQLGIAIENKHLQAETQRRALQLSVLHELDRAISSSLHLKDIYHAFTLHAVRLLPCDHMSITLLEEEDIRVSYVVDDQGAFSPGATLSRQGSVVSWVMAQGQPLLRHNIATDVRYTEDEAMIETGIRSLMVIPLRVKGRVIGSWNLGRQAVGAFGMEEMEIAQSMADQLAITIENARLYDEIHQYLEELHTLNMISQAINSTLDLQKILTLITEHTIRLVGVEAASVVLRDEGRGDLWIAATSGGGSAVIKDTRLEVGQGIVGWVVQHGEPALVPDVTQDDRFFDEFDQITRFTTHSILCVPLQAKGQTIGAVEAINKVDGAFNQEDLRLLGSLVAPAATAIENARLFEQAQQELAERQRAEAALEKERALLARRVEERTADLSAANAELARAARLKDEFLASMSHELRTPLTAVLGLSDVLKMEVYGPLTEKQVKSINSIEDSGRHLLELINDILDLSKIEAGKLDLDIAPISIQSVCQTSLQFIRQAATKKQLRITSTYDESVSVLMADERRIKQILVNLLSNAVKFTPAGGQVGLEVRGEPERQMVNFIVWDTGIGIAPEGLTQLFQPFVQLDSRLSRQYGGTGLGLALVRRMVEMHGGGIAVESELNEGSRFTVSLPLHGLPPVNRAGDEAGQTGTEMPDLTAIRQVFIIEDSPTAANQLKAYLARLGIKAVAHPHGKAALEQVLAIEPDVIILDLLLPDSSGWDILTQLKVEPGAQDIPVVIVSVIDEPEKGLALGAAEYLIKPVTQQQLQEALGRIVQSRAEIQEQPQHPGQPDPGSPLILLAEDQEQISEFLVDYLEEQQGYRVVVTRNGLEALAQARMERPDLILMDIQMPEMDGLEATRRLRATDELAETPIIALTALAMPGDRERCLEAGASAYLSKPISLKELGQVIQSHLV
jgi:signal transduction histidine kinase/DNA-binding response OmpR family regulator